MPDNAGMDIRIGIDLGGTKIEGLAMDPQGKTLARERIATPQGDYPGTLAAVAALVQRLEQTAGGPARVGVGTPGSLSPTSGLIRNANSTCLNDRPLDRDLAARLSRPVRIANDADCFALSEATDGSGAGAAVVFGVIIGTGTGGGVAVDGRLLSGPNRIAGEWGHNPLPWPRDEERPGPACYCGKRGCIETFLSGPGLAGSYRRAGGGELDAAQLASRAAAGEPLAGQVMDDYVDRLSRALAGIINVLDPDVIVLGGGLSKLARLYTDVPQRWTGYVFSDVVNTRLLPPRHGDAGGVRGAAWLWPAA